MANFVKLPYETLFQIMLDLNYDDLVFGICQSNKTTQDICNSRDFWIYKLQKDGYPHEDAFTDFGETSNPSRRYLELISMIKCVPGSEKVIGYNNCIDYLDVNKDKSYEKYNEKKNKELEEAFENNDFQKVDEIANERGINKRFPLSYFNIDHMIAMAGFKSDNELKQAIKSGNILQGRKIIKEKAYAQFRKGYYVDELLIAASKTGNPEAIVYVLNLMPVEERTSLQTYINIISNVRSKNKEYASLIFKEAKQLYPDFFFYDFAWISK